MTIFFQRYFYHICSFVVLMLGICIWLLKTTEMKFSDFHLQTPSGILQNTEFPFFMDSKESGFYRLYGQAWLGEKTDKKVRIIPDDEIFALKINQQNVNLYAIPADQRKDYSIGFTIDLSNYLHTGKNDIEIIYSDAGGKGGILFAPLNETPFHQHLYKFIVLLSVFLIALLLNKTRLKTAFKIILLVALLIRLDYFSVTQPNVRDHDLGDHTDYIEYMANNWKPASVEMATGGAFFHPPFYYFTGALVYKAANYFFPYNKVQIYRIEQLLSLTYSMIFVFFGLLIIQNILSFYRRAQEAAAFNWKSIYDWKNAYAANGLFWICGALFALWPSGVIHSTRIGNDPLLYCFLTASLYFTLLWFQTDKKKHLIIASLISAFGIVTKANCEIMIATIAVLGFYKMLKTKEFKYYFKLAIVPCLLLFSALAITVSPAMILKMQGKRDKLYVDNIDGLSSANIVGNTAANYFWFDAKIFVTEPFTSPYDDRMGRQYFWNYLGKTGLYGEFSYSGIQCINMAVYSSFLFVLMLLLNFYGLFNFSKRDYKTIAPPLLAGFFLWAGVTYMRMTFPANIDFRYILPITVCFAVIYGITVTRLRDRGALRLACAAEIAAVLFCICSIFFILGIKPN